MLAAALAQRADCLVVAVDPAAAMLALAKQRYEGASVSWVLGDARTVRLSRRFDLVLLTGHAFQVLLTPDDQAAALTTIDSPRAQTVASYLMRAAPCRSLEDMDARLIATGHRSPAGQPGRRVERRVASSSLGRCHY